MAETRPRQARTVIKLGRILKNIVQERVLVALKNVLEKIGEWK
jgi:hypothetical protein